jgi:hypothetical protein
VDEQIQHLGCALHRIGRDIRIVRLFLQYELQGLFINRMIDRTIKLDAIL